MDIDASTLSTLVILVTIFCFGDTLKISQCKNSSGDVYSFSGPALDGKRMVKMDDFRGKVILVVNVATYWGYTQQYVDLNALYPRFNTTLSILAVPCNQFGKQEPGDNAQEILNGLRYVRPGNNFRPSSMFTFFAKQDINGGQPMPLYNFLKAACPPCSEEIGDPSGLFYSPIKVSDVTWNFEKFLISHTGVPLYRFHPSTEISTIIPYIEQAAHLTSYHRLLDEFDLLVK